MKKFLAMTIVLATTMTTLHAAESHAQIKARYMKVLKDHLRDPASAMFRNIQLRRNKNGDIVLCGEANAKNGFGGYTGFQPFIIGTNDDKSLGVFVGSDRLDRSVVMKLCGEAVALTDTMKGQN